MSSQLKKSGVSYVLTKINSSSLMGFIQDKSQEHSKSFINNSFRGFLDDSTNSWMCSSSTDIYKTTKEESTFVNWYIPEDNTYISPIFHPSSYERGFTTSAYVGIFLCTIGIFVNLLLFAVLLSSRKLRVQYLYIQILNIALADISFIVTVDSFTVYFELLSWRLGAAFCKTWMILDVALPSVSLFGLLLLNVDRIVFAYKTSLYQLLMQRKMSRAIVLLCPWIISCVVVNTLWLGFPAETEEHLPGACVYGIIKDANTASMWLTVFIPSLLIFVLLIFIFIAGIGELPSAGHTSFVHQTVNSTATVSLPTYPVIKINEQEIEHTATLLDKRAQFPVTSSMTNNLYTGRQRRFVAALLAVDFISLAITLPYSAYSQVNITCNSSQTCQSFVALFQILSWMKSSVTCFRPVFFILLTDIYLSFRKRMTYLFLRCRFNNDLLLTDREQNRQGSLDQGNKITLTQVHFRDHCSGSISTTTTVIVPPQMCSPTLCDDLSEKQSGRNEARNVYNITGQGNPSNFV